MLRLREIGVIAGLSWRYLGAHRVRTAYLVLTLILAFASYILLAALGSPFAPDLSAKSGMKGTIKINALYGALPARYAQKIVHMPGIKSVTYGNYLAVYCRPDVIVTLNSQVTLPGSGLNGLQTSLGVKFTPAEARAWHRNRDAVLVGDALARRCHWHPGQLFTLKGLTAGQSGFPVRVVGIYHAQKVAGAAIANQVAAAHYAYLNGLRPPGAQGSGGWMLATAADPSAAPRLAAKIDAYFARRSPPTTSSVSTVTQGALAQFGNVLKIVALVMAAVFACALIVTVNIAAHAAAERRAQLAVLRVLGFSRTALVGIFAGELLYVVLLGGGGGIALGLALWRWVVAPLFPAGLSALFMVPTQALYLAPALAAGVVILSGLIPLAEVLRLRAVRLSAP